MKRRNLLINLALLAISLLVSVVLCEAVFRMRYAHYFYAPREEVQRIQQQLVLHPQLGFTWQPNISPERGVLLANKDVQFEPLSTDSLGILNCAQAIAARNDGAPIDVIGLGDSFVELAHHSFFDLFQSHGLTYYSLAIHRQAPPQYTHLLRDVGLALKPHWVLYGLYENDFEETLDYENWKASGLDWFTFHSGTWCGPPVSVNPLRRFAYEHFRGFRAFRKVLDEKRGKTVSTSIAQVDLDKATARVSVCIEEAQTLCTQHHARLLLVLIPSKNSMLVEPTPEYRQFDTLLKRLPSAIDLVDLRPLFRSAPAPSNLYYEIDGHWSPQGVALAGTAILDYIQKQHDGETSSISPSP